MTPPHTVALLAHPDDEVFCCGRLARDAQQGGEISIVTLTRGEGGFVRQPFRFAQRAVSELRAEELRKACALLGAELHLLQLPDGEVRGRLETEGPKLIRMLGQLKPTRLLTFGPDGAYGHRDHQACWDLAVAFRNEAPRAAMDLECFAFPKRLFAALHRKLRRFPFIDRQLDEASLGTTRPQSLRKIQLVPNETALKERVLCAHQSQLDDGEALSFLGPEVTGWLLQNEWYDRVPWEVATR